MLQRLQQVQCNNLLGAAEVAAGAGQEPFRVATKPFRRSTAREKPMELIPQQSQRSLLILHL